MVLQHNAYEVDNNKIDNILNNKDSTDMQNEAMKEDLHRNREENGRLNKLVQDYKVENSNYDSKLQHTQADKKNLALESDNLNHEVNIRVQKLDEVSRERSNAL